VFSTSAFLPHGLPSSLVAWQSTLHWWVLSLRLNLKPKTTAGRQISDMFAEGLWDGEWFERMLRMEGMDMGAGVLLVFWSLLNFQKVAMLNTFLHPQLY